MSRRREIRIVDGDAEAIFHVELPDGDDLQARARSEYRSATTPAEQRGALRLWLEGAVANEVDEDLDPSASLGTLLIACLDALELGTSYPILQPQRTGQPGHTLNGPTARARAHVVAAVDLLARFPEIGGVTAAIRTVADACGLSVGAVRSLRDQVHAGQSYAEIREQFEIERRLIDRALAMPAGRALALSATLLRLRRDRTILALQHPNTSRTRVARSNGRAGD